ncbi:hypothetical protein, partial [Mesotoga sp. H07.pep.5.3]|uniref:hypothetical protein n=1 Tax=Mesotoga sp. H07.pep.5.3 TaxID=1421003 RepID=UPI001C558C3E
VLREPGGEIPLGYSPDRGWGSKVGGWSGAKNKSLTQSSRNKLRPRIRTNSFCHPRDPVQDLDFLEKIFSEDGGPLTDNK